MAKKHTSYFDSYFKESKPNTSALCDHPGCKESGLYPAPKSPKQINIYLFFCIKHIQDYNISWNYYKDMPDSDVLAQMISDRGWRRPTWPCGKKQPPTLSSSFIPEFDDLFEAPCRTFTPFSASPITAKERKLLDLFELDWPFSHETLVKQYRILVRKYHPDLNQGDKKYEEKLKMINQAYQTLKKMPHQ